jgi:hypothetical protein
MGPSPGFSLRPAFALLKRGVTLEQAQAEVRSFAGALPNGEPQAIELVNARDEMGLPARRVLLIFRPVSS